MTIFLLLGMVFFQSISLQANPDSTAVYRNINRVKFDNFVYEQDTATKRISVKKENDNKVQQSNIYTRIQNNAEKRYVTRKLYGLFFRKQNINDASRVFKRIDATEKFIAYTGKRINQIEIIRLNAFGQSVHDSTLKPTSWLEKTANGLHIRTANFIVKKSLLFKEGDELNPVDFAESEQLLRNYSYIEDANILVEPLADSSQVRVTVITKDSWSIGGGAEVSSTHSSELSVYDKNVGGLGLWLNGTFYYDAQNPNRWGRKGELSTSNILGSFIQGDVWFREGQGYQSNLLSFKRDFYASSALYGGGASILKSHEPYRFKSIDSTSAIGYNTYDYWIGRSFRVSPRNVINPPQNLVLSFRYLSKYFSERPSVSANYNYVFQNKEYYLVGFSLTKQELFKANLIYSFGSTEDIPTGYRVHFTTGLERGEFEKRYYVGNDFTAAEVGKWGYLFTSARTGGFISSSNQIQQITTSIRSTYFSNLFSIRNLELRQFVKIDYTRGLSRYLGEGETIFLDNNNGIRGLTSKDMSGTTRFVINLETVAFSPLFIYGFRFAYFAFCDLGFIGSANEYLIGNQSYSGFGIGIRIRNENLVFNTFQLRLGFYPKLPANADVAYWLVTGQQKIRFENFRATGPQIVPFE